MPLTSAWLPKTAKPEDITSVSVHRSLGWQHGPPTPTWPLVVSQTTVVLEEIWWLSLHLHKLQAVVHHPGGPLRFSLSHL